jgi:hypothetical protein
VNSFLTWEKITEGGKAYFEIIVFYFICFNGHKRFMMFYLLLFAATFLFVLLRMKVFCLFFPLVQTGHLITLDIEIAFSKKLAKTKTKAKAENRFYHTAFPLLICTKKVAKKFYKLIN